MDVDGVTGGFNFQHAWTSGWLAAKTIGRNEQAGRIKKTLTKQSQGLFMYGL